MNLINSILNLVLFVSVFYIQPSIGKEICQVWFMQNRLEKNTHSCLIKCASTKTNHNSFYCPNTCSALCNSSIKESFIFKLSRLYPGLTFMERALTAKHPIQMLKAYQLSWKAEWICFKKFKISQKNDASDACRHFVWAALLYQKFGLNFSQYILQAHETDPFQTPQEKAMDLANNQLGLTTAKNLLNKNQFIDSSILNIFQTLLSKQKITVLSNQNQKPKPNKPIK